MIKYENSELSLFEDEFAISLGLRGMGKDGLGEAILQVSKIVSDQDEELGHDKSYLEYMGSGGYGLLDRMYISNEFVLLELNDQVEQNLGSKNEQVGFFLSGNLSIEIIQKIHDMSKIGKFQIHID